MLNADTLFKIINTASDILGKEYTNFSIRGVSEENDYYLVKFRYRINNIDKYDSVKIKKELII